MALKYLMASSFGGKAAGSAGGAWWRIKQLKACEENEEILSMSGARGEKLKIFCGNAINTEDQLMKKSRSSEENRRKLEEIEASETIDEAGRK